MVRSGIVNRECWGGIVVRGKQMQKVLGSNNCLNKHSVPNKPFNRSNVIGMFYPGLRRQIRAYNEL